MTHRLVIAPEAERDLKEAYVWYERHRRRLGDVIFVRRGEERDESLLLHELVHVLQWRRLGESLFLALYGLMLLRHGYAENPLELMAADLQHRFDAGTVAFDVGLIVDRRADELRENFAREGVLQRLVVMCLRTR